MLVKIFVLNIGRNSGMHLLFQLFAIVTVLDLAKSSSCDKDVTYIRDDVFSNLRLTEGTIDTHDGVKTHAMCAVRCKRDPDCVSFFFKNKSGICQINSVIYLSTAGSESSVGSVYFRKKMECPAPPSVPNSQPQFDVISPPNATGTVLQYTCDGGYTPEGNVTCRVDGTWTQMTCHGAREVYIVGLTDLSMEGVFVWDDGTMATGINWEPGEPNNRNNEDCAALKPAINAFLDVSCYKRLSYICEKVLG
ncbi:uncharacterized protein LOC121388706 isoform X2 [Gigantopelta aegis]|uniref:uncharacterized protein LOC121388706 isoform X2 n=1 Tax=Gigantopelta aegis TaxID=1735272 RepID=UPI001B88C805|nr:uncharacterized protein LOC121388706 isoform X2 [Gigantopelta aegis]